jgi:hypothetical protein
VPPTIVPDEALPAAPWNWVMPRLLFLDTQSDGAAEISLTKCTPASEPTSTCRFVVPSYQGIDTIVCLSTFKSSSMALSVTPPSVLL